ncbi:hypothetical protein L3Q82_007742 [Scortum barcoo]|uniref:Uncharacterized protein n=1 Tax=Scortum barcoo TaxID=214431 RepID=A0ACB8WQG9_9TELE|nr:hypothetical protein L3Q82_007742 [Scortum barcoo]
MESPVGALSSTPPRDSKKAGYSVLLFGPYAQTTARDPIPNPKAQGSDPLVHRGELQHMAAELGSYKQAHTSPPPLTLGNSRVVEGPAPLKELGSRAQAMRGDVYNTLPLTGENPMDYWIRLNKAVDVADECLRRQGRNIENPAHEMKNDDTYWKLISCNGQESEECERFLEMMAGLTRWRGENIPDKVGTVKLTQAVTLQPKKEYLLWGRQCPYVTWQYSDGGAHYIKVCPSRHYTEDFTLLQNSCERGNDTDKTTHDRNKIPVNTDLKQKLKNLGLGDVDIDGCQVSPSTKSQLVEMLGQYQDVFSKHHLDCGEAKGFVHRIRLTDDRPFRLPYRRVPPAHYQKLRQVLTEMEEQGIIRKSVSEFASPLVMVWKKNGNLRICTDFRWLNARTIKDAHPLPHQADCLAALGGNSVFSTMDLTSGFYNLPMHEEDKKYTAFTTPLGLHEYNRMPQGLCNSPASFMRMMLSIFGDLNFSTLLCYLDDLLVFAPSEQEALSRLEAVFQRLREHNLKLSQKKCHLLRRSVKFLGHVIDGDGVAVDPGKVEVIVRMTKNDLMEDDSRHTPSVRRVKSFLGMIFYYQHFIPNCSSIAKPLFALTAGQKRRGKTDFSKPLILSIDASLDGLGAVLSQIPEVWTDNNPLTYLMTKPKLDACEQRWVAKLSPYTFDIKHISGSKNIVADALSRDPFSRVHCSQAPVCATSKAPCGNQVVNQGSSDVKSICEAHIEWEKAAESRAVQFLKVLPQMAASEQSALPALSLEEFRHSQESDPDIQGVLRLVERGEPPSRRERSNLPYKARALCKQWHRLKVQDGVLYRIIKDPSTRHTRQRFFWPQMGRDIKDYVKCCQ